MSQQLELLMENPSHWKAISIIAPDIQKKEIKPFVVLALKELEGECDERTARLASAERFACVRAVVRHVARVRSARPRGTPAWDQGDLTTFLHGLGFSTESAAELGALVGVEAALVRAPTHRRAHDRLHAFTWKIDLSRGQALAAATGAVGTEAAALTRRHACVVLSLRLAPALAEEGEGTRTRVVRLGTGRFHALRFTLAAALKNMIVLERRRCMRD